MKHSIIRATNSYLLQQCREFIDTYHSYIQYAERPSRKMYYCLMENGTMVGVFALGSCFPQSKDVRQFMKKRDLGFNEVANNIVYCLSGHQDKNAGSKFLSLCRQDAINWWQERYGDELKAFQTFILPPRTGAVYKADNWEQIGITSGDSQKSINVTGRHEEYPKAIKKTFRDGAIGYFIRENNSVDPKLIFMRLVTDKDRRKAIARKYNDTQCECHFLLDRQMALF